MVKLSRCSGGAAGSGGRPCHVDTPRRTCGASVCGRLRLLITRKLKLTAASINGPARDLRQTCDHLSPQARGRWPWCAHCANSCRLGNCSKIAVDFWHIAMHHSLLLPLLTRVADQADWGTAISPSQDSSRISHAGPLPATFCILHSLFQRGSTTSTHSTQYVSLCTLTVQPYLKELKQEPWQRPSWS
jgi:hypothetical protein